MKAKLIVYVSALALTAISGARAQSPAGDAVPVTVDNFVRAESDVSAANLLKEGSPGKLTHHREPAPIDNHAIIRPNRDTLYSLGVFDLDAGPVTITLPDAGKRFMSLQSISEDHYTKTFYDTAPRTFTRQNVGKTIYKLDVKDVPVDGFWSVSLYNAQGYYEKNPYNAYSLNITAKKSDDGSIAIQFGGCDGKIANCLPTTPGWNYTVHLYRPRAEILEGKWKFPQPRPVN